MNHFLAPSILSADFGILKEQIEMLNASDAHYIHVDVMDGVFVQNISLGFPIIDAIAKVATKPLDIHLMISEPDKYIERFAVYKPEFLTVHFEVCTHLNRTLNFIRSFNVKAGVAVNPHSPVFLLEEVISDVDLLLIMSVNPGYGGQRFIHHALDKIRKAKQLINKHNAKTLIEVDGGISLTNALDVINAGADIIVAGNSVFGSDDIHATIKEFVNIA